MKTALAIALLALAMPYAVQGRTAWNHIPYPRGPEGSVLTGDGVRHAQFIIMVNKKSDPGAELHQLFTAAAVRDALIARFHLQTRPGHIPKKGYLLTCLSRARFRGDTLWLAAWAARVSAFDSIKAFSAMVGSAWHGGCAPVHE